MKKIHLFFSYYYKNKDYYSRLREMLEERGYFDFSIAEVDENQANNEEYIKTLIRPKIKWASVMVVIIGPGTYTRNWVNWEIDFAANYNKRIVAVYLHGQSRSKIPRSLRRLYNEDYPELALVRWNTDSIIYAIRGNNSWDEGDIDSGCFIATAAYGTPLSHEVYLLKKWRDRDLEDTWYGRILIPGYYRISPTIARYISKSNWRKKIVRVFLFPLIKKLQKRYGKVKYDLKVEHLDNRPQR